MADNITNSTNLTPSSSPELGRLFKLGPSVDNPQAQVQPPANLPSYEEDDEVPIEVIEQQQMGPTAVTRPQVETTEEVMHEHDEKKKHPEAHQTTHQETIDRQDNTRATRSLATLGKKLLPYVIVFAIGLGLYFFYFNSFSFSSLFKRNQATTTTKVDSAALSALQSAEANNYNAWISQFFFDVSDTNIVGMNTDVSGNGLTNFQKYLLNLNPKMYDTLGDNQGDGQKIIDGKNPWTGNDLTDNQRKIAETYFDKELISNRIAAAQAQHDNQAFAPFVSNHSPYYQAGVSSIVNGDAAVAENTNRDSGSGQVAGVSTGTETAQAANNPSIRGITSNPVRTAPVTGRDGSISSLGIDTSKPGSVNIPSINVTVPLIWSQDPKNFETDLKNGVIHYPGTPLPGDIGTSYISGHSSGYFWDKSQYKVAFAKLGDVKNGDSFTITVYLKNGQQAKLHYRVDGRAEYSADDPRQFLQSSDSVVALSTCWPVNTTARRLVLYGVLTQIEK